MPDPHAAAPAPISGEEARRLIRHTSGPELEALIARAGAVRAAVHGAEVALCGIVNAKSGHCPENCGFCSQSAHFEGATAPEYPLMSARQIADQAKHRRAGRGPRVLHRDLRHPGARQEEELATIEEAVKLIRAESGVEPCASLGLMRKPELERLKGAGLMHYHHNLETARSFFDQVCTTHTYDEQLETIRAARDLGYQVCSGGILGMGETPGPAGRVRRDHPRAGHPLRAGQLPQPAPRHPHGRRQGHHPRRVPGGAGGLPAHDADRPHLRHGRARGEPGRRCSTASSRPAPTGPWSATTSPAPAARRRR